MESWDDNEYPLAYFITFRTYGTWLHGDKRGSIDRYHNGFGTPRMLPNTVLENQQRKKLKSDRVTLDPQQRAILETAIRDVCNYRGWNLFAINARTNHVHLVAAIGLSAPESAVRDFKSYSTKALKTAGCWEHEHSPWVVGSSKRYLWKESSITNACEYVLYGQGDVLPTEF